jgi:hypothetical protein
VDVCGEYVVQTIGERTLLLQACHALDRAEGFRADVAQRGVVLASSSVRSELSCRALAARILCRMGLNAEPLKAPHRPGGFAAGVRGE